MGSVRKLARAAASAAAIVALSSALIELATRLYFGFPLLELRDWRTTVALVNQGSASQYHRRLGWTHKPHLVVGMQTIEHGIRKNGPGAETITPGGILVVGDSFAAGSEVHDHETWPAQIERVTGQRTYNAAIGGYGTDQIVMRAEELLPLVKPSALIVGFLDQDILRASYSVYGAPKPYYLRRNGEWVLKNDPVPPAVSVSSSAVPAWLPYSAVAHVVAINTKYRNTWFQGVAPSAPGLVKIDDPPPPEELTCYLVERLAKKAVNIRRLLVMQYGGHFFAARQARASFAVAVLDCAKAAGYEIVDEFEMIRAIADRSIDELRTLYVMHQNNTVYGHMSAKGNAMIGDAIARQLMAGARAQADVVH